MVRRLTRWGAVGAALVLIAAAVPAYGYWRAVSRGYVSMSLINVSSNANGERVLDAALFVRDAGRDVLAKGGSDDRFGIVRFVHPEFGSCEEEERSAPFSVDARKRWDKCIAAQFRWQAEWAPRARYLDLRFAHCDVANVPITLRLRRDDWWLWWVPLPHIGGDPYTEFSARVTVDTNTCEVRPHTM